MVTYFFVTHSISNLTDLIRNSNDNIKYVLINSYLQKLLIENPNEFEKPRITKWEKVFTEFLSRAKLRLQKITH